MGRFRHVHDILHVLSSGFSRIDFILVQATQHDTHTLHFGRSLYDRLLPTKQDVSNRSGSIPNFSQKENIAA